MVHQRWLKTGGQEQTYLLLSPNLTIVALAAASFLKVEGSQGAATWTTLVGLFISMFALFLLPRQKPENQQNGLATKTPAPEPRSIANPAADTRRSVLAPQLSSPARRL
jgi:hypothetical protein